MEHKSLLKYSLSSEKRGQTCAVLQRVEEKTAQAPTSSLHQKERFKENVVRVLRNGGSDDGNSVKQATNHLHHGLSPLQ